MPMPDAKIIVQALDFATKHGTVSEHPREEGSHEETGHAPGSVDDVRILMSLTRRPKSS